MINRPPSRDVDPSIMKLLRGLILISNCIAEETDCIFKLSRLDIPFLEVLSELRRLCRGEQNVPLPGE